MPWGAEIGGLNFGSEDFKFSDATAIEPGEVERVVG
jgi:hypothetical protein